MLRYSSSLVCFTRRSWSQVSRVNVGGRALWTFQLAHRSCPPAIPGLSARLAYSSSSVSAASVQGVEERHYDCTGRLLRCGKEEMDDANHVLSHAISGNEKYDHLYSAQWPTVIKSGVLASMALIDMTRKGQKLTVEQKDELKGFLQRVSSNTDNDFDLRERYLATAALAWDAGNHDVTAVVLENLLAKHGSDMLVSKLMQEAYILAGNFESALGCLIRHPATFNTPEAFGGTVVGLTTLGYLENQRLSEAEESGKRAVAISSGRDLLSLCALLDAYYLSGKSSDMIETLSEYDVIHGAGLGKYVLLTKKGFAHVMRGNCNGAFKAVVQLLDTQPGKYFTPLALPQIPIDIVVDATLLLWQVVINIDTRHVIALDEATTKLWTCMVHMDEQHVMKDLVQAILLSASLHALESKNCREYLDQRKSDLEKESSQRWNPMKLFSDDYKLTHSSTSDPATRLEYDEETKARIADTKKSVQDLLQQLDTKIVALSALPKSDAKLPVDVDFPFLVDGEAVGQQDVRRRQAVAQASKAILHFGLKDYSACVKDLVGVHREGYRALGLCATQRDVFWQTFIEGLFRDNQLVSAGMLLSERTVLVPNDGQTWKRLATIHRARGEEKLAEEAQYTSWQLGIGQGGFGGAI